MPEEEISEFDEQYGQIYLANCMCCCCREPSSEDQPVIAACRKNDKFCQECLTTLFRRAIQQPATEMPPRCCGIMVPLALGFQFLTSEEIDVFKVLFEEWATPGKERIYCPAQECQQFIPVHAKRKQARDAIAIATTTNESAIIKQRGRQDSHHSPIVRPDVEPAPITLVDCPSCTTKVCTGCKDFDHPASRACQSRVDTELIAQLKAWDYRPCPRCGHYIRRMFGCMHMVCVCGEHFCWGCQKRLQDCEGGSLCDDDNYEPQDLDFEDEGSVDIMDELTEQSLFDIGDVNMFSETRDSAIDQIHEGDDGSYESYLRLRQAIEADDNVSPAHVDCENIRPIQRGPVVNLDAGDPRHWELNVGLDLGDEPGRDEHGTVVWDGNHPWTKLNLIPNIAGTHSVEVRCNVCWETVVDAEKKTRLLNGSTNGNCGLYCLECRLVVCRDCQPAIGGWIIGDRAAASSPGGPAPVTSYVPVDRITDYGV